MHMLQSIRRIRVCEVNCRIEYFVKPQQNIESARQDPQNGAKN